MDSSGSTMLFFNINQVINSTDTLDTLARNVNESTTMDYRDLLSMDNATFGIKPLNPPATFEMVVLLSILFFLVGIIGIVGNSLVIFVIIVDRKMRNSVTNLFIMNLAIADLLIMLFGVPEIVQFMLNRGWLMGLVLCKFDRFILVLSLYVSILSLVSVCVERFVAIVYPIKAHIMCGKKKILIAMALVWPSAIACALPTAIFNQVRSPIPGVDILFCITDFPDPLNNIIYKFMESGFFYFVPTFIQVTLYAVIAKRLYISTDELHTRFQMRNESSCKTDRTSDTIKARKGVVKMLVASVLVYILCYAPPQILLFYNTFSPSMFQETWSFLVFVNIIAYVNSAANPILYSIFSQNFRRNFKKCLCYVCLRRIQKKEYIRARFDSFDSRAMSRRVSSTRTTTVSRL